MSSTPLRKSVESAAAFNARSKLSRMGRKFLMTSAAANSRKSCCSRTARLRALSNSACRRARRSRSASRSALSFSTSDAASTPVGLTATRSGAPSSPPSAAGSTCSRSSRSRSRFPRPMFPSVFPFPLPMLPITPIRSKVCRTAAQCTTPPTWYVDNPAA